MAIKKISNYKGWKIRQITSGKAKGIFYAEKKGTSFGILGDNSVPSLKNEIDKRSKSKLKKMS